jgi:signal peptidase I
MNNSSFLKIIIVGIAIGLGIKTLVFEAFTVPTESMEPTILRGDVVWVNKMFFRGFHKNDIVAFERNNENFVKRIVGTPSDSVFTINGIYQVSQSDNGFSDKSYNYYKIPKKGQTIFFDKNNFDFYQPLIEKNEGVQAGRLMDKIFINNTESNSYTFKKNYYFVQGDNAQASSDSRYWGLISENQLIGKAAF